MPTDTALPLSLDLEDFKGDFSFDALFGGLMDELLSEYRGRMTPRPHHPRAAVFPAIDEFVFWNPPSTSCSGCSSARARSSLTSAGRFVASRPPSASGAEG
ncbi:hypothetical protein PVAP13_5KG216714 [Panicum virgatum]|uniref:Uncharacterized protein n=1 Tax=Panicum virgatum TaxID=38727 RepID=A0A8T0SKI9_PANVG|nr:hypothetical protein PVAP13_5KG216714 [Panicum virgatum]